MGSNSTSFVIYQTIFPKFETIRDRECIYTKCLLQTAENLVLRVVYNEWNIIHA